MPTDELRSSIERFGDRFSLGEYEIEAYLVVLEHGQLTASEIADRTDIPQPRVYDTVRSLADRGLVELRETRPMKVVAVDPEGAFEDVQTSLSSMIEQLGERFTAPSRETEAVSLVKSRSTILRHVEEVLDRATFELSLALTPDLLSRLEPTLREAIDRGVTVDLLVTPAADAPDPETYDYEAIATTVRTRRGITTPVIAVADGTASIYATQDALKDEQDRYGVIFNRSALGFLVATFFGTVLWTTTEETLAEDGEGRPFPRRYASIRRCVKDLIEGGGEYYVSVSGRDVLSGAPRVVSGRVTDVSFEVTEEVAGMTVETDTGPVTVGGRVAAYEDVEAHEIRLGRDEPPAIDDS